ncbi:hypothetical protein IEO21_00416 [Rhodonia placenta]|uniref:Uncharacterized protein n=1 Tax=Rhodonia placenta TaxID=104341 RepID=A0A8H7U7F9_9APHY|nr:hypothetical protein IEO21_00416 [Postia placenta]
MHPRSANGQHNWACWTGTTLVLFSISDRSWNSSSTPA